MINLVKGTRPGGKYHVAATVVFLLCMVLLHTDLCELCEQRGLCTAAQRAALPGAAAWENVMWTGSSA